MSWGTGEQFPAGADAPLAANIPSGRQKDEQIEKKRTESR